MKKTILTIAALALMLPMFAQTNSIETTYAKSDFVPGDEIIFDDDQAGEQLGEFPSKWDLIEGNAEIAKVNGEKVINMTDPSTEIAPLMKNPKNYLSEAFTLEFDFLGGINGDDDAWYVNEDGEEVDRRIFCDYIIMLKNAEDEEVTVLTLNGNSNGSIFTQWKVAGSEDWREQTAGTKVLDDQWNHVALSFNKRALKLYLNGNRIVNIPNATRPQYLTIKRASWDDHRNLMKNVRICKGAVPLYDRLMTDGKIISYGITFDIGKSNIKPESIIEINRIVQLMKENADLKFEIQGHTDNTGSTTVNQTLSEQRANAVMNKMIELGIAKDRLTAVGKGQTSPIAENSTDEGRAKNRRVEFVKK